MAVWRRTRRPHPGRSILVLLVLTVLTACGAIGGDNLAPFQDQSANATATMETQQAQFAVAMETLRNQYRIPGMSVLVIQHGTEVFAEGFGYADLASERPADEITPYRLASLTKPIAATVILQLVEEGKIDLNAPFAAYDPAYANLCAIIRSPTGYNIADYNCETEQISVRHHMSHTTQGRPGDSFLYQGGVYGLLARVAGSASGQSFETLLTERIINPLNMASSAADQRIAPPRVMERLARPYRVDEWGNLVPAEYPGVEVDAAAGMISTVVDLAKFNRALDDDLLISAASRELMWTPTMSNSGQTLPYGLGWFVQEIGGTRVVWHFGWWPDAFSSLMVKIPEQDSLMVLLANSDGASAPFAEGMSRGDLLQSPFAAAFIAEYTDLDTTTGRSTAEN